MIKVNIVVGVMVILISCASDVGKHLKKTVDSYVTVVFSERGQIDASVTKECDVPELLHKAITKKVIEIKPYTPSLVVQVDKVKKLAWGSTGASWGGNELGVTAHIKDKPEVSQYFSCRADFGGLAMRGTACSRLAHCANEISEQVPVWLRIVHTKFQSK